LAKNGENEYLQRYFVGLLSARLLKCATKLPNDGRAKTDWSQFASNMRPKMSVANKKAIEKSIAFCGRLGDR